VTFFLPGATGMAGNSFDLDRVNKRPVCTGRLRECHHFAQRVERSSLHRRMKKGALGYEDEKFSYVALARAFAGRAPGRVIRRPAPHSGWVELTVCRDEGIRTERVSRKQGAAYRAARKAAWGDPWPPE
jgi:ribosomal protein RSM22 (predicted rRNA methylase)